MTKVSNREEEKLKTYINWISASNEYELKWLINWTYQFLIKVLYAWVFWVLQKTKYDSLELTQEEINLIDNI